MVSLGLFFFKQMCIITDIHGSVINILLWLTNCARSLVHLQCLTTHTKTTKSERLQHDTRWLHVGSLIVGSLNELMKRSKPTKNKRRMFSYNETV